MGWRKRFRDSPLLMGILNVTPDSFFDGGKFSTRENGLAHAFDLIEEGADIIDIGGESTRPYSSPVSVDEELERVIPFIEGIRAHSDIFLSIDTRKGGVAREALTAGASMINDVSGLSFDEGLARVAAAAGVPIIVMHSKGTPEKMQRNPYYDDVVGEILDFFAGRILFAKGEGIAEENIILDPGIGFGKRVQDNLRIVKELKRFKDLGRPVAIGTSMKSFIGRVTQVETSAERLEGTLATVVLSCMNGADIIRVHDVAKAKRVIMMTKAVMEGNS
jgi:dihydropteroate synthase